FSDFDTDEIATYEEVELFSPKQPLKVFRPIIFIGPPGVGRNELKRRLRASNPNHFEEVVPCKLVISIKLCHNAIRKIHHINSFP
ncbi:MAGUK p55 subfamily member 7 isoform X3, partial [Biomphalaria glabrata]